VAYHTQAYVASMYFSMIVVAVERRGYSLHTRIHEYAHDRILYSYTVERKCEISSNVVEMRQLLVCLCTLSHQHLHPAVHQLRLYLLFLLDVVEKLLQLRSLSFFVLHCLQ